MSKRIEIVKDFYGRYDEETRLDRTRRGQLEYFTTMAYIHRFVVPGSRVLEIGAGTGKYSIALAREGLDVTAVELLESNLKVLREKGKGVDHLKSFQGDATGLSQFESDSFDVVLVFGPMYHLYDPRDVDKAIDEAIRVTKPNGTILFAFLSVYAIMYANYFCNNWTEGEKENYSSDYQVLHFEKQLFTGYDVQEFEALFEHKPVKRLTTVSADGVLEIAQERPDFAFSDEDFEAFKKWHLAFAEKRELLGSSNHLLLICRKTSQA
ncbi:MAG: class I SAM-dependent methyltransferase [Clostridia bacterium]|nr:class I SAM-dependent methyltransferase [Clostridia bacterium]